ncbi:MAG TPA: bacteriohemerythrin [Magnetovibrio sp.]
MSQIVWHNSYSVGVDALDAQHKILISLINQLDNMDSERVDLREVMDKLDWYVREHFALEESMLSEADYDDLKAHKAEHRDFEKWLHAAQSHLATGGLDATILARSIHDHLQDWLTKHILVVDMEYKGKLPA